MKKVFIDMDGVLAEYRNGCSEKDLMKEGYFLSLKPEENMLAALNMLIRDCDSLGIGICVLTKVYPDMFRYSVSEKLQWRDKYMPDLFDSEFVMVDGAKQEKSEAVKELIGGDINSDCILIDDYNANLQEWFLNGGTPVKYVNAINDKNRSFIGERISRDMTPDEIYNAILSLVFTSSPAPAAA